MSVFGSVGGNRSTRRKPTQTRGVGENVPRTQHHCEIDGPALVGMFVVWDCVCDCLMDCQHGETVHHQAFVSNSGSVFIFQTDVGVFNFFF